MGRVLLTLAVAAIVVMAGLTIGAASWYSTGVDLQESVIAQYQDNQNEYDSFWKSVKETAQVPERYKEDFKEIALGVTKAQFGSDGSRAMMQWFRERELRPDSRMYMKLQSVIESGRKNFQHRQRMLLDKQRRARTHYHKPLGRLFRVFVDPFEELRGEFSPPKDLDGDGRLTIFDYNTVTSDGTKNAFLTGKDTPVKVFGK